MSRCPGVTRMGHPCKNGPQCHIHGPPTGPECPICLSSTGKTRATQKLRCGHSFHRACIDGWTNSGGQACPMCRRLINPSKYKVSINIENLETGISNVTLLNELSTIRLFNGLGTDTLPGSIEIEMMMDQEMALQDLMHDLNIRLSDVNTLIFDTE